MSVDHGLSVERLITDVETTFATRFPGVAETVERERPWDRLYPR
ncbi:MAG: hypothetical protein J07HX64_02751 [halophilic archaeon J07HX64]|nr:MAG: hypothetical protein J07HX64_02751 [halophilic archaeon J07HX64]